MCHWVRMTTTSRRPTAESWLDANFVVTSSTAGCLYDNLRRRQWRQCRHHDGSGFAVDVIVKRIFLNKSALNQAAHILQATFSTAVIFTTANLLMYKYFGRKKIPYFFSIIPVVNPWKTCTHTHSPLPQFAVFGSCLVRREFVSISPMMTSSNENIFCVIGPLCGEFTGQWRGALMFPLICAWIKVWANSRETGDLRQLSRSFMTSL